MSLFLKAENNLGDVDSPACARANLGIGTLATQNADDVVITGGTIQLEHLVYEHPSRAPGRILVLGDDGELEYVDPLWKDWLRRDQRAVPMSGFRNDPDDPDRFVKASDLQPVAFEGSYESMTTRFFRTSELINDVRYLNNRSNLQDVEDAAQARANLGIGDLGIVKWNNHVLVDELTLDSLYLPTAEVDINADCYLTVRPEDMRVVACNIPYATTERHGLVRITDDLDVYDSEPSLVASAGSVVNFFNLMKFRLDNISSIEAVVEHPDIDKVVEEYGLLRRDSNLSDANIEEVRKTLQLGSLSTLNVGDTVFLKDIVFDESSKLIIPNTMGDTVYLQVDAEGKIVTTSLQPTASDTSPGMVYLLDNYVEVYSLANINETLSSARNDVVPSVNAVNEYFRVNSERLEAIRKSVPTHINQVEGFDTFLTLDDNMRVDNPSIARTNLELHPIAHTGDWMTMENRPTKLSDFENDTGYLTQANCLSELNENVEIARRNLGLGDMALLNANNVGTLRGDATFQRLELMENLQYQFDPDNNGHFLMCTDDIGTAQWRPLPKATTTSYGTVRLTSDTEVKEDDMAISSVTLYRLVQEFELRIEIYRNLFSELLRTQVNVG